MPMGDRTPLSREALHTTDSMSLSVDDGVALPDSLDHSVSSKLPLHVDNTSTIENFSESMQQILQLGERGQEERIVSKMAQNLFRCSQDSNQVNAATRTGMLDHIISAIEREDASENLRCQVMSLMSEMAVFNPQLCPILGHSKRFVSLVRDIVADSFASNELKDMTIVCITCIVSSSWSSHRNMRPLIEDVAMVLQPNVIRSGGGIGFIGQGENALGIGQGGEDGSGWGGSVAGDTLEAGDGMDPLDSMRDKDMLRADCIRFFNNMAANAENRPHMQHVIAPLVDAMRSGSLDHASTSACCAVANLVGDCRSANGSDASAVRGGGNGAAAPEPTSGGGAQPDVNGEGTPNTGKLAMAAMNMRSWESVLCGDDLTPVILQLKNAFEATLDGEDYPPQSRVYYHSGKLCEALSKLCRFPLLRKCLLDAGMIQLVGKYMNKIDRDTIVPTGLSSQTGINGGHIEEHTVQAIVNSIINLTEDIDTQQQFRAVVAATDATPVGFVDEQHYSNNIFVPTSTRSDSFFDAYALQTLWLLAGDDDADQGALTDQVSFQYGSRRVSRVGKS